MHGRQFLVREVHYGTDGAAAFLRLDFDSRPEALAGGLEVRVRFLQPQGAELVAVSVRIEGGVTEAKPPEVKVALRDLLEIEVPLRLIGTEKGTPLRFQISLWQGGLPLGTLPHDGALQFSTADPVEWAG